MAESTDIDSNTNRPKRQTNDDSHSHTIDYQTEKVDDYTSTASTESSNGFSNNPKSNNQNQNGSAEDKVEDDLHYDTDEMEEEVWVPVEQTND